MYDDTVQQKKNFFSSTEQK